MEDGHEPDAKPAPHATPTELNRETDLFLSDIRERTAELKAFIRASNTELLKVIYGYAYRIDTGVTESDLENMMLRSRLSALESRVTDIERRIDQPPMQTH